MALNGLSGSSGLNFNNVNSTVYESIRTQETNLRQTLSTISTDADGNVSQADMLAMQQQISQWTMMVEVQSTISKSISDSLKSVIQKSS
ncbi:type III secretion protein [Bordetella ansorpii]|uniref:Type III secretion protein n=1 Tax=Bordetella ansorpii TaxID=288768 RepID=A0A157NV47_9BORD|nr:EscF/YscF/HrpA family type III secretion system needle major subunit [Bordetella ansorpii]SAI25061.1 type III secretion protein [Bordetella ansorpii]SAI70012.1 type III secretion protein [Bordetella ansorpii]